MDDDDEMKEPDEEWQNLMEGVEDECCGNKDCEMDEETEKMIVDDQSSTSQQNA